MADAVELVGGDARADRPADLGERVGREPSGDAHRLDGLVVLALGTVVRRRRGLADVLGSGDVGGTWRIGDTAPGVRARARPDGMGRV